MSNPHKTIERHGEVNRGHLRRGLLRPLLAGALVLAASTAQAFRVELKDVAPDRIERQRAEAIGQIPFPGTPNVAQFEQRLKDKGMASGAAMFIRVFKAESELEVWLQKGNQFELFGTYPVCHWSGTLGPKISEGDKQSPEGIYTVSSKQLHMIGRHPRSLNLGFPNILDRQFQRTGSYILIHGGCGSVGCFAMTNPVIEEIFSLAQAALKNGQEAIQVHAFPFRLTEARLQSYALNEWYDFWRNLKDVHDHFERTRRVPKVTVCEGRYWVEADEGQGEVASRPPLAACEAPLVASLSNPMGSARLQTVANSLLQPFEQPVRLGRSGAILAPVYPSAPGKQSLAQRQASRTAQPATTGLRLACAPTLPSCRKWIAQQTTQARRRQASSRNLAQGSTGHRGVVRR